mmetsp:Transcript_19671/g.52500  ORF Transcript_19671/g.52500 Transcript_19671/m.52500 type:complete len:210 (-) Transcript_19671:253-882(-)
MSESTKQPRPNCTDTRGSWRGVLNSSMRALRLVGNMLTNELICPVEDTQLALPATERLTQREQRNRISEIGHLPRALPMTGHIHTKPDAHGIKHLSTVACYTEILLVTGIKATQLFQRHIASIRLAKTSCPHDREDTCAPSWHTPGRRDCARRVPTSHHLETRSRSRKCCHRHPTQARSAAYLGCRQVLWVTVSTERCGACWGMMEIAM